jgi:hypothetical protein
MRRLSIKLLVLASLIGSVIAVSETSARADDWCTVVFESACLDNGGCCPTPWDPHSCRNGCRYHEAENECFCLQVQ